MSRSSKKGPWVEERLMSRIEAMNTANQRTMVKTWSRASVIFPEMVGHKLGEFAPTRTYRGHADTGRRR
jgi:small subunit ribosomal protein S19